MIYPNVIRKIRDIEKDLINERVEHIYVFDSEGRQIVHQIGEATRSVLLAWEIKLIDSCIMTHNHPGKYGTSFSQNDIHLAIRGNLLQVRAVASDRVFHVGNTYRYVMYRPENGWPKLEKAKTFLENCWGSKQLEFQKKVNDNLISSDESTAMFNHVCMKMFSKEFNVRYRRYLVR